MKNVFEIWNLKQYYFKLSFFKPPQFTSLLCMESHVEQSSLKIELKAMKEEHDSLLREKKSMKTHGKSHCDKIDEV